MSIVGLDSVLANQGQSLNSSSATGTDSLGKDAFLRLLTTQLQYQNPLDPMEDTEFTSQLAQFSSLEQLTDMGLYMEKLNKLQGSINNIQALSFIGKQVSATGNIVEYSGQDINLNFELEDSAAEVVVKVYTDEGTLVRTINMADAPRGDIQCLWDGKNDSGNDVSAGRYVFSVAATGYDESYVESKTYATGTVTGVRYDGGITYLTIGDKEVTISDVEKILG
ncbi:MAG: flagellar hook capping FlgD N-terminal domain-containing protein [Thermodesulfobacteriota bacterium]|nr:flagellar hook capping FlgD N-terminal domain-containing protein [Thermodesulfobacteriota bacterium]